MDVKDILYIGGNFGSEFGANQEQHKEFDKCFGSAKGWYSDLTQDEHDNVSMKLLRKRCHDRVMRENKPVGFLPAVVWWFLARQLITWLVNKMMDHIYKSRYNR
jgi:hypothetical protein